jgi:Cof subfamily protein (haloacid dehalogenase superfamily)
MISLICVDVDGTLVGTSGVVSQDVWDAADAARARGVRLAVCSGRPAFGLARHYAERLDPEGWHVFQNGASVVRVPDGEVKSSLIDPAIVTRLIARARVTGRVLELYSDTDFAVEIDNDRTRRHAGLLGVPFKLTDLDSFDGPVVRAQWLIPHIDVDVVLAEADPALTVLASLSPLMPDTSFVNMTTAGVDKASAIRIIADAYGIALEDVMMVGDGANDVSAMRAVGVPIAMGNSEPPARHAARYVVADVDRGGLMEAFRLASKL